MTDKAIIEQAESSVQELEEVLALLKAAIAAKDTYDVERSLWRGIDALGDLGRHFPQTTGITPSNPTGKGYALDFKAALLNEVSADPSTDFCREIAIPNFRGCSEVWGLARYVIRHALDHYEEDGWDYLVETVGHQQIMLAVREAQTPKEALKLAAEAFGLRDLDERRKEVQGTEW